MKPKILYLSFASLIALIIAIFISVLIGRESTKIQSVLEETNPQQIVTPQQSALSDQIQQLPSAYYNRPAITVVKPQPKESSTPYPEEKINKRQQPERLSASSSESALISEGEPDEPASGITKIGKHPTEEENKEMNARGIVMY